MMLCEQADSIPTSDEYVWEVKADGERAFITKREGRVTIKNRNNYDVASKFPELVETANAFAEDFILDGEIVYLREDGTTDFGKVSMRSHLSDKFRIEMRRKQIPLHFIAFDIIKLNGVDLTQKPYLERKELLRKLISSSKILYSHHLELSFLPNYLNKKIEGVVFKKKDSIYELNTRSKNWLKYKFINEVDTRIIRTEENSAGKKCYCKDEVEVQVAGKESRTLKEGDIITVNYLEKLPSGKLRMPTFKKKVIE